MQLDETLKASVEQAIHTILDDVVAFRHERHRHPELTWREEETAKVVAQRLSAIDGVKVTIGVGRHGVVGLIEGAKPGPTVALRADMDALPVKEKTGAPYASEREGVMHACGHDGHMANLYGAALVLARHREHLQGRVKLIFQPAEEGGAGADAMCKDGALEDPKVDVIFGLHAGPSCRAVRSTCARGRRLLPTRRSGSASSAKGVTLPCRTFRRIKCLLRRE